MTESLSRALVLIAAPGSQLPPDAIGRARAALSGYHVFEDRWLSEGDVRELLFAAPEDAELPRLRADVIAAISEPTIDVALIADGLAYRKKKLLVADMESTIIEQEMLDELGDRGHRQA